MKICFLYNSMFRHGGIQRVAAYLMNELSREHEVEVICSDEINTENNPYEINLKKIKVSKLDILQKNKKYYLKRRKLISRINRYLCQGGLRPIQKYMAGQYYEKRTQDKMIGYINKNNYDIVIGCSMPFNMLLGSIEGKVNCKLIGWENNSYDSYFNSGDYLSRQEQMCGTLLKKLDKFIVLTHNDCELYKKNLGLKSEIIPNPISFECRDKVDCKNKVLLSIGRLEPTKGFDLLIDSVADLLKLNQSWKLKIIGEGNQEKEILKKIKDTKIEKYVELKRFTNNIQEEYMNASVYICASRYESFGLTILEAMECGLSIVTFDTSGPAELVVDEENGFIVHKGNTQELRIAVKKLMDDIELRKKMGKISGEKARQYSKIHIKNKWKSVITENSK